MDRPIFIKWLPGGSTKTLPTGHRRGRPPRRDIEHSWQKVLLSLYDGRRRGRPPRPVCLIPWSHRPKGHRRGRPPNNYPSLETDPASTVFFIGLPDSSYLLHILLQLDINVYPQHKPNSTFQEGGGVVNAKFILLHFCVGHSILSIHHYPHENEGAKRLGPGTQLRPGEPQWRKIIPRQAQIKWTRP